MKEKMVVVQLIQMALGLSTFGVMCKQMLEAGQCSREDKMQVKTFILDGKITNKSQMKYSGNIFFAR